MKGNETIGVLLHESEWVNVSMGVLLHDMVKKGNETIGVLLHVSERVMRLSASYWTK